MVEFYRHDSESEFTDKLVDDGGIVMVIRIIYKDKNVGRVNQAHFDELIKMDRIAAFCRPNDEWVGVEHKLTRLGAGYPRGFLETVEQ